MEFRYPVPETRRGYMRSLPHKSLLLSIILFASCSSSYICDDMPKEDVCLSKEINSESMMKWLCHCRVIEGHLILVNLYESPHFHLKTNYSFPDLVEIKDFLAVYKFHGLRIQSLFPNLRVIRGENLFLGYAMVIFSTRHLSNSVLPKNLGPFPRGGIYINSDSTVSYQTWSGLQLAEVYGSYVKGTDSLCKMTTSKNQNNLIQSHFHYTKDSKCHYNCLSCLEWHHASRRIELCLVCKYYRIRHTCTSRCPDNTFNVGHSCVLENFCHKHNLTINRRTNQCLTFDNTNDFCINPTVSSGDDAKNLAHCEVIEKNLVINIKGSELLLEDLRYLSKIRKIKGYLLIKHSSVLSMGFLRNLNTIEGQRLQANKNAFVLENNNKLKSLDVGNIKILRGQVLIKNNRRLCHSEILKFTSNYANSSAVRIHKFSNGFAKICGEELIQLSGRTSIHRPEIEIHFKKPSLNVTVYLVKYALSANVSGISTCQGEWKSLEISVPQNLSAAYALIGNLESCALYEIFVKGLRSESPTSIVSKKIVVRTTLHKPPNSPQMLRANMTSEDELILDWNPHPVSHHVSVRYLVKITLMNTLPKMDSNSTGSYGNAIQFAEGQMKRYLSEQHHKEDFQNSVVRNRRRDSELLETITNRFSQPKVDEFQNYTNVNEEGKLVELGIKTRSTWIYVRNLSTRSVYYVEVTACYFGHECLSFERSTLCSYPSQTTVFTDKYATMPKLPLSLDYALLNSDGLVLKWKFNGTHILAYCVTMNKMGLCVLEDDYNREGQFVIRNDWLKKHELDASNVTFAILIVTWSGYVSTSEKFVAEKVYQLLKEQNISLNLSGVVLLVTLIFLVLAMLPRIRKVHIENFFFRSPSKVEHWNYIPKESIYSQAPIDPLLHQYPSGSFSWVVPHCTYREEKVVIKFSRKNKPKTMTDQQRKEARFLTKLKDHTSIVKFYGVREYDFHFGYGLVMEYMDKGSLAHYLEENIVSHDQKMDFGYQIFNALLDLKRYDIVHRYISVKNCLVSSTNLRTIVKLSNFNMAIPPQTGFNKPENLSKSLPFYLYPPESFQSQEYTSETDCYGFGIFLYELFTNGENPYKSLTGVEIKKHVLRGGNIFTFNHTPIPVCPQEWMNCCFGPKGSRLKNLEKKIDNSYTSEGAPSTTKSVPTYSNLTDENITSSGYAASVSSDPSTSYQEQDSQPSKLCFYTTIKNFIHCRSSVGYLHPISNIHQKCNWSDNNVSLQPMLK